MGTVLVEWLDRTPSSSHWTTSCNKNAMNTSLITSSYDNLRSKTNSKEKKNGYKHSSNAIHIIPSTSTSTFHVSTVSVVGLSGPVKGHSGVGKSTLCNRLVRPHYEGFYLEHNSTISQADFSSSPVINNDHWLYWGDVELNPEDYAGKTTHIRVVEQTEFLDDESFLPHRSPSIPTDYVKRALRTIFEGGDKLMYICQDQLGLESDFEQKRLPESKISIDAFIIVYDISRDFDSKQAEIIINLMNGASKTKKPIIFVATKCDMRSYNEGFKDLQQFLHRKEFKNANFSFIEVSALRNVNVTELLYLVANIVDKSKNRPKILPYPDAAKLQKERLGIVGADFHALLQSILPREEWPKCQSNIIWPSLLNDFGMIHHPSYQNFIACYGSREAKRLYDEHMRSCREWWFEHEIQQKLPLLHSVLPKLFDRQLICNTNWDDLLRTIEEHPAFDQYFRPLGSSLDRNHQHWDDRIPSELLQTKEARKIFQELQKELVWDIARERKIEQFLSFLRQKEVITPGRLYEDAKVLVEELATFEQILTPDVAFRTYESFQNESRKKAEKEFSELLLEKIDLFLRLTWDRRLINPGLPILGLTEAEYRFVQDQLQEDKRFRALTGLFEERKRMICEFASFVSYPIDDHCPASSRCANKALQCILENQSYDNSKFYQVHLVIHGEDYLVDEFISSIKMLTSFEKLFKFEHGTAQISCHKATDNWTSHRIRTPIYLIDSHQTLDRLLEILPIRSKSGLPPIFVHVCDPGRFDLLPTLHQRGNQIAKKYGALFVATGSEPNSDFCNNSINDLSVHFRRDQIFHVLNEVCAAQLDLGYYDLRVQMLFSCGDPFPVESVLKTLLDQSNISNPNEKCFMVDFLLPKLHENIRVNIGTTAYHSWLVSEWHTNYASGYVLMYSPLRPASWKHAEVTARALVNAGDHQEAMQAIGGSILLIAVDEPTTYFRDKDASKLLTKGSQLAEELGCKFATISPTSTNSSQIQTFIDFFELLYKNDPLPILECNFGHALTISTNDGTHQKKSDYAVLEDLRPNGCASETLNSNNSSASRDSCSSGSGRYFQLRASRNSVGGSTASTAPIGVENGTKSTSPTSNASSTGSSTGDNKKILKTQRPRSAVFSRNSPGTNAHSFFSMSPATTAANAPLAKPEFIEVGSDFYYRDGGDNNCYASTDLMQQREMTSTSPVSKSQRRLDKILPKFGRLRLDQNSYGSIEGPPSAESSATPSSTTSATLETPSTGVDLYLNGIRYVQAHQPIPHDYNLNRRNPPKPPPKPAQQKPSSSIPQSDGLHRIPLSTNSSVDQMDHLNSNDNNNLSTFGTTQFREKATPLRPVAVGSEIRFRVNGAERDLPGLISRRKNLLSMSSESIFDSLKLSVPVEESDEKPREIEETIIRRPRRREPSKVDSRRNRSSSSSARVKSFFTTSESSSNLAKKVASSWKAHRNKIHHKDDVLYGTDHSEVGSGTSSLNSAKRGSTSGSVPQSPVLGSRTIESELAKEKKKEKSSSAVSTAFSWLPNRSPKRSTRAKSESLTESSSPRPSSASPVETLKSLCSQTVDGLPIFVIKCVEFIEKNGGLDLEGLYRVPGNQSQVAELEKAFKADSEINWDNMNLPVHAIATALKKFLDTLPEPLIPVSAHDAILECVDGSTPSSPNTAIDREQAKVFRLRDVIHRKLPEINRHVLHYLSSHLNRVAERWQKNSMDIRNLAKIWGPTLFRPEFDSFEKMTSLMARFEMAMFLLLQHCDIMFLPSTGI
uniref:Uncharacterized protein n=1 Tax=Acrobeloides nanus TaxID=290746 RepID=A0A914C2G3_9BILA